MDLFEGGFTTNIFVDPLHMYDFLLLLIEVFFHATFTQELRTYYFKMSADTGIYHDIKAP